MLRMMIRHMMDLGEDNSFKCLVLRPGVFLFSTNLYFDVLESNCKHRVTHVSPRNVYYSISKRRSEFDWSIVLQ